MKFGILPLTLLILSSLFWSLFQKISTFFWTHAGIYVGDVDGDGIGELVEAVKDNDGKEVNEVVVNDITKWDYNSNRATWDNSSKMCVELLRVKGATANQKSEVVNFVLGQVGDKFNYNMLTKSDDPNKDSWYCSELAWAAYKNQGINIEDWPDLFFVSPQEINDDGDTELVDKHEEMIPKWICSIIGLGSPADIVVTDPDGFIVSKEMNEIPGAVYIVEDVDNDGDPEDFVGIPDPKIGDYLIEVIPDADALPTDTFSLKISDGESTMFLAEDTPIADLDGEPYIVTLARDGSESTLPIWLWPVIGIVSVLLIIIIVILYRRTHKPATVPSEKREDE